MNRDWRTILRFSTLGLAIAGGVCVYFAFPWRTTDLDILVGELSLILCPPSILCLLYCGHEIVSGPAAGIWCVIGLTNSALYAIIGAAYVGLHRKREGHSSS